MSLLGCTAHEGRSTLNMTLERSLFHLCVPFSSSAISLLLLAADYSRLSLPPLLLRSYFWLSAFAPAFTFLFDSFTSVMGRRRTAEDYQRMAAANGWVPGARDEEDSKQQTKDEPSNRYRQNQQEVLD